MYCFTIPIYCIKAGVLVISCQKLWKLGSETFVNFRVLIESIKMETSGKHAVWFRWLAANYWKKLQNLLHMFAKAMTEYNLHVMKEEPNGAIYPVLPLFSVMLTWLFSNNPVSDPEGYYKNFKHFTVCVSFTPVQWQTQSGFSPGTLKMRYKHKWQAWA